MEGNWPLLPKGFGLTEDITDSAFNSSRWIRNKEAEMIYCCWIENVASHRGTDRVNHSEDL